MLHVADMKEAANDNTDTWIKLAAATANLVRYLESSEQKQSDREREAQRSRDEEKKKEEQRAYVEQRLRETAEFEARFRPGQAPRRKRN